MRHCLSFDVEEHFQVSAFDSPKRRDQWDAFESRVERSTDLILEMLETQDVRATFFVLGWIAERHPDLIIKIASQGHEIASHGYAHELITNQTPISFREDIRKAKCILENIVGDSVIGYRAPSFSITAKTGWALPILSEEGYLYDSSIFPVIHDRYGIYGANPWCHQISTTSGPLWEVPPSTTVLGGVRIPVAGGGYLRLFPYPVLKQLLCRVVQCEKPLVMYLHPWEFDPGQPKMAGSLLSQVRHYLNLHTTESKLQSLLSDFAFGPIREVIAPIREACIIK